MEGILSIISKILAGGQPSEVLQYSFRVENCDEEGVLYRVIATTQSGPDQKRIDLRTLGCNEVNELIAIVGGAKA